MDVDDFVDAVRRVAAGGTALDPEVVAQLVARRRRPARSTTSRRASSRCSAQMAEGRSNAGIAEQLVLTVGAVEKHIARIFAKLRLPADRRRPPPRARSARLPEGRKPLGPCPPRTGPGTVPPRAPQGQVRNSRRPRPWLAETWLEVRFGGEQLRGIARGGARAARRDGVEPVRPSYRTHGCPAVRAGPARGGSGRRGARGAAVPPRPYEPATARRRDVPPRRLRRGSSGARRPP